MLPNRPRRLLNVDGLVAGQRVVVVGNNAAEEISLTSGIISGIRNAPQYVHSYNDFNINYYQANMNLSGGISGSPALAADGSVVGMVSLGFVTGESISYLLPLCMARNALESIRKGELIPRGDIQCRFWLTPFHECKRLGLSDEHELQFRQERPDARGLLVVNAVLSSGPADGKLMVGDILVTVNAAPMVHLADLMASFDSNVDGMVDMLVLRGGKLAMVAIRVVDLHRLTPKRLLSMGGLVCHDITYPEAMKLEAPAFGVYVTGSSEPSLIGDGDCGWILLKLDGQPIHNLESFFQILKTSRRGQRVLLTYEHLGKQRGRRMDVLTLDAPDGIIMATRDDSTGSWHSSTTPLLPPEENLKSGQCVKDTVTSIDTIAKNKTTDTALAVLPALVHVESRSYIPLDGFPAMRKHGMGVVVDPDAGLVVVSNLVVPHKACHVTLAIPSGNTVRADCLFCHPHHGYAIIRYVASALGQRIARVRLSDRRAAWREEVKFVFFTQPDRILHHNARVANVMVSGPAAAEDGFRADPHPTNADIITIDATSPTKCESGVLLAADGSVLAIWLPFFGGITTPGVSAVVSELRRGAKPRAQILPADFEGITMANGKAMGVPDELIHNFLDADCRNSQLFMVRKTLDGVGSHPNPLLEGDVIYSLDGELCTSWAHFDIACPRKVRAVVVRQGEPCPKRVDIHTVDASSLETNCCIEFCGAYLQKPPSSVRQHVDQLPSEVYVSHIAAGSPAERYALLAESFITMVNDMAVKDLASFKGVIAQLPKDQSTLKLTLVAEGRVRELGIRQESTYFPPTEWVENGGTWEKRTGNEIQ